MGRRFSFIIIPFFLIACGSRSGEFSSTYLLETYGSFKLPVYKEISEPVFDSEESFWTAAAEDRRVLYRSDLEGNRLDRITLYFLPAVLSIDDFELGPDVNSLLFTISTDYSNVRDICKLSFSSSDHNLFQLDGTQSFLVPNPLDLSITALSEPWGNQVAYLGTLYDYGTSTASQNVYIYDYGAGTTQIVNLDPSLYPLQDGNLSGNYYFRIDAFPDGDFTDAVHSFIICQRREGSGSVSYSFKIIKSDGSVDFDAAGTYEYQNIGGIRWLSQEEVLMTVRQDDRWQVMTVNSEGVVRILYKAERDVAVLQGLSLSPLKQRCITQIKYNENDSYSEILILKVQ